MHKVYSIIIGAFLIFSIQSCSKKSHPAAPVAVHPESNNDTSTVMKDTVAVVKKTDSIAATKPVVKRKPKEAVPKVIVVNDKYASKSVDGRFFYDLQGHRYWRNNKDGKYYLFNKSMLTDDAFKKPD